MENTVRIKSVQFIICLLLTVSCSHLKNWKPESVPSSQNFFRTAWAKNLDPQADTGNLPIALQSPAIDDGIVYVGDNRGYLRAFELENGKEIWSVNDGSTYHSAPVIYKNKVIYGTVQGRVIARDAKSGETIFYNVDLGSPVETAGTVYNGKIFFQLRNHQVFCLDVETGKILWGFKKSLPYLTTLQRSSTPVVINNKVYVGFADGTLAAISIEEGILVYETKLSQASKFLDVDSTPVLFDNKIFIGPQSSNVVSIEPNTGKIIRRAEFSSLRSPIIYKDSLVYGTTDGEIIFCDKNLVIQKHQKVSKTAVTSIVLYKNNFVVGTMSGELLAISSNDLKLLGKFEFGHSYSAIFSDLVSKEEHLTVLSSRNRLFTFY